MHLVVLPYHFLQRINDHFYIVYNLCNITAMEGINNHDANEYYPLSIIEDSDLQLSLPSPLILPKITTWKDERLDYLEIPKGLIEILQTNGFTIEMILEYGPSQIAEKLGIDDYVAQIIFTETTRAINSFNKSYSES
jgi:hypothetical protein